MKIWLMIVMCAAPAGAAEPLADLLACRELADQSARLACFDRESALLAQAPIQPTVAAAVAPSSASARPATPSDAQQKFGLSDSAVVATEEAAGARPAKASKIETTVIGLSLEGNGRTLFTFSNGQVWHQLASEGDMLAKLGDGATISRAMLGSYWLQLKNGRGCKVARLR